MGGVRARPADGRAWHRGAGDLRGRNHRGVAPARGRRASGPTCATTAGASGSSGCGPTTPDPLGADRPVDRQRVRRSTSPVAKVELVRAVPPELARRRPAALRGVRLLHATVPERGRGGDRDHAGSGPVPLRAAEHRAHDAGAGGVGGGDGGVGAEPPARRRPVLHRGRAPVRAATSATGPGTCSPTSAGTRPGWPCLLLLLLVAGHDGRADAPGSAPRWRCCASSCCSGPTPRSSTPATSSCASSASRSCCRRAGCCGRVDAVRDRRRGRIRDLLRAPFGMRFLQLEVAVGYLLSAWTKRAATPGRTAPPSRWSLRIEDLQRFVAPELAASSRSVLLHLLTWAHPRLRGHLHRARVAPAAAPLGARRRRAPAPRHRRLPRHRLLQLRHLRRLPRLPPARRGGARLARFDAVGEPADRRRMPSRSSQPSRTATARGSCRRRWPAPFMIRSSAPPWASTRTRASNTGTRSSSLPCTIRSGRGARRPAHATARRSLSSRVHSSKSGGKRRLRDHPHLASVLEQPLGVRRPVVEVGRRAERGHPTDVRVVGGRTDGQGAARAVADQPHAAHLLVRRGGGRPPLAGRRASRPARSCPRTRHSPGRPVPWPATPSRPPGDRPAPAGPTAATAAALTSLG